MFVSREQAVAREKYLKSGRGREWLKDHYEKKLLKSFERQAGAWINLDSTKIGYEISFNKYFYKHKPLRSMEEVASDIIALEQQAEGLIADILGIDVKEVAGVDND